MAHLHRTCQELVDELPADHNFHNRNNGGLRSGQPVSRHSIPFSIRPSSKLQEQPEKPSLVIERRCLMITKGPASVTLLSIWPEAQAISIHKDHNTLLFLLVARYIVQTGQARDSLRKDYTSVRYAQNLVFRAISQTWRWTGHHTIIYRAFTRPRSITMKIEDCSTSTPSNHKFGETIL